MEGPVHRAYSASPVNGPLFAANLLATILALGLAVRAGLGGRRRQHYTWVGLTLILLLGAIWQAELFGRRFEFESWRLRLHLACAFSALVVLPGVAWSGVGLARARVARRIHRRWVVGFVVLVCLAVLTAGWMFLSAEPARTG